MIEVRGEIFHKNKAELDPNEDAQRSRPLKKRKFEEERQISMMKRKNSSKRRAGSASKEIEKQMATRFQEEADGGK